MPLNLLPALLLLSGAGALTCELVWMRRLALVSGSSAVALTFTLSTYMAGLGIGGLWASRRQWATAPRGYGILELAAAGWALSMPALIHALDPMLSSGALWASALGATLALLPPAILHGATSRPWARWWRARAAWRGCTPPTPPGRSPACCSRRCSCCPNSGSGAPS